MTTNAIAIPGPVRPAQPGRLEVQFELDLPSRAITIRATLEDGPISLSRLATLARSVSDQITTAARRQQDDPAQAGPCRPGCAACCRYLVPLSVPEAFDLQDCLAGLAPGKREKVECSLAAAAGQILGAWPGNDKLMTAQELSHWYADLNLPCPFLAERACSIYSRRPLACREHLAAGRLNPRAGAGACPAEFVVDPPISVLEAVATLTAELEDLPLESVMLPLAPHWAEINRLRNQRAYPASRVLDKFVEILIRQARDRRGAAAV